MLLCLAQMQSALELVILVFLRGEARDTQLKDTQFPAEELTCEHAESRDGAILKAKMPAFSLSTRAKDY